MYNVEEGDPLGLANPSGRREHFRYDVGSLSSGLVAWLAQA